MDSHDEWLLALDPLMTPAQLVKLYERHLNSPCGVKAVLCEIANHPNTPIHVLREICNQGDRELNHALAANPNLPADRLSALARSPANDVLEHVIWNPRTSLSDLERLGRSRRSAVVRRWATEALAYRTGTKSKR